MKNVKSRRLFLRKAGISAAGALLLPSVIVKSSKAEMVYENNSLNLVGNKLDLSTSAGKSILVKGKIYNKTGLIPISGAAIEVLSPSRDVFNSTKPARVLTNENGEYEFLLDSPTKVSGKAPRINFTVSNDKRSYSTVLIVGNFDAYITDKHWEQNHQLGNKLFPVKENHSKHSVVSFNLSI